MTQTNIQTLLSPLGLETTAFPVESRYHGIEVTQLEQEDSEPKVYLKRRFIPQPEQYALLQTHSVEQHDRIDNLAHHYLGDPLLYWRICDANNVMHPLESTQTVGKTLRITLPEGFPGSENNES